MVSVKESSIELIKKLPDDCSLEDIQYELYAKAKIESGIKDIEADKIISETQMQLEMTACTYVPELDYVANTDGSYDEMIYSITADIELE